MANLTYRDRLINQRDSDGYVNATQMAKANDKRVNDWIRLKSTNEYTQGISTVTGIPVTELIQKVSPNVNQGISGGTFIHPKLAIELGRWVSVDFAIWCDTHIKTLMETGSTQLKPKTALQLAKEQVKLLEEIELKNTMIKMLEEDNERQSEVIDELFDYSSIIRVAKFNNIPESNFNWRVLKAASKNLNLEVKKVPCPRFVTKNLYSHTAWRYAYPHFKLPETTTLRLVK